MPKKLVNKPKEQEEKNKKSGKTTKEKTIKEGEVRADEASHNKDATEDVFQGKINKYGFVHINKKMAQRLNIAFGKDQSDTPCAIELLEGERGFKVELRISLRQ